MKIIKEDIEKLMLEMSNIRQHRSGICGRIWVDEGAPDRKIPHNRYRIKYSNAGYCVSISFFDVEPKIQGEYKDSDMSELPKVIQWVKLNREFLFKLYDSTNNYDIGDFLFDMKPV